jgi:hypothetical protein
MSIPELLQAKQDSASLLQARDGNGGTLAKLEEARLDFCDYINRWHKKMASGKSCLRRDEKRRNYEQWPMILSSTALRCWDGRLCRVGASMEKFIRLRSRGTMKRSAAYEQLSKMLRNYEPSARNT